MEQIIQSLMGNELTWLILAFFILLGFAYKPAKKAILSKLDEQIMQARSSVMQAEEQLQDSMNLLKEAKDQYEAALHESVELAKKASEEANNVMIGTNKIIEQLWTEQEKGAKNYEAQEREAFMNEIKADVILAVLTQIGEFCSTQTKEEMMEAYIKKIRVSWN